MKRTLLLITLLPQLCLADRPLGEQLTSALYAEEVERDLTKAAQQYEALLKEYNQQRDIASAAAKRLSEIYEKQGMDDKALSLKQYFAPNTQDENRTTAPGRRVIPVQADSDQRQLKELMEMQKHSPDILHSWDTLEPIINNRHLESLNFMLKTRQDQEQLYLKALMHAANKGDLEICRILVDTLKPRRQDIGSCVNIALSNKFDALSDFFLESAYGTPKERSIEQQEDLDRQLMNYCMRGRFGVEKLLSHGANPNRIFPSDPDLQLLGRMECAISAMHVAAASFNFYGLKHLVDHGGNVNLTEPASGITPLHAATAQPIGIEQNIGLIVMTIDYLLLKGADLNLSMKNDSALIPAPYFYKYPDGTEFPIKASGLPAQRPTFQVVRGRKIPITTGVAFLPDKATALDLAILCHGQKAVIETLKKAGAKLRAENADSMMRSIVYMENKVKHKHSTMRELLKLGAKPKMAYIEILKGERNHDPEGVAILTEALEKTSQE